MLSANEIVRVTAQITPVGLLRREFGISLLVTTDETLPPQERTRTYPLFDGIKEDFAVGTEPYDGGNIYFSQNPFPKNLVVGRYIDTAVLGEMTSGTVTALLAEFTAISDGSFKFKANVLTDYLDPLTTDIEVTGMDFNLATSLADVAAVVEASLPAVIEEDSFEFVAGVGFVMKFGIGLDKIIGVSEFTTAASGTDVSELLAMTVADSPVIKYATVPESVEEALDAMVASDGSFYFITADNTINDTAASEAISAWAEPLEYMYSADSTDAATLTGADSPFNRLSLLKPGRTFGTWSATADYKGVSAASRFSSVNFSAPNAIITLMLKDLPGTLADVNLTPSQVQILQSQRVNFYSERSGVSGYEEGFTFNPDVWADVRYWLDWFVNAIRVEEFNLLKQTPTKVPQTEAGMNALKEAAVKVCKQGIFNGGIAGGVLSPALTLDVQQSTGNSEFDGDLADGYLVYAAPIAQLSQSDRNQRKAQPLKIWLKGSGAIHSIDIAIIFEN